MGDKIELIQRAMLIAEGRLLALRELYDYLAATRVQEAIATHPPQLEPALPSAPAAANHPTKPVAHPAAQTPRDTQKPRRSIDGLRREFANLLRTAGPHKATTAVEKLRCGNSTFYAMVNDCTWFEREADGYHLTAEGHRQLENNGNGD